ncbi:MAG: transcription antitermination factor NusB [Phycisphaerales bacterium]
MTTRRDIRELALQALYQLDARNEEQLDVASVARSLGLDAMNESQQQQAKDMALGAYRMRQQADELTTALAPTWPAHRQPAVDRAILRLAWWEMAGGATPAKVAINEAIELAKKFSTEKSPAFINGVLDKMMRKLQSGEVSANPPCGQGGSESADPWLNDAMKNDNDE